MEEINLKNGILIYKHKLKKGETYKVSASKKFYSISIYKKPQIVKGIASYCEDGKHVLFVDYDDVPRWLVEQDYHSLQRLYNLPPGYLFSTKEKEWEGTLVGNYHIICLAKFYPAQIYEILSKTHADINYMSMPLRRIYRNWVLRISTKRKKERPTFVKIIGENINLFQEISKPHLDFLNKIYPLSAINYENTDKKSRIFLQEYQAS